MPLQVLLLLPPAAALWIPLLVVAAADCEFSASVPDARPAVPRLLQPPLLQPLHPLRLRPSEQACVPIALRASAGHGWECALSFGGRWVKTRPFQLLASTALQSP
mmetsp:Transcript_61467/g.143886  ORF Transcript_61467/g.143886 Transcript_61467/m.143886 type:complete len:105 (+) Transcript_61467:2308-2622(+)